MRMRRNMPDSTSHMQLGMKVRLHSTVYVTASHMDVGFYGVVVPQVSPPDQYMFRQSLGLPSMRFIGKPGITSVQKL